MSTASMRRAHRLTPQLNEALAHSMHEILSTHPIASFFLSHRPNPHFTQSDQLAQIYETVLIGGYQTLEEWRRDARLLRNSTASALAAIAASELQRLFDKAYRKLCASTFTEWSFRVAHRQERLLRLLQESPCGMPLLGSTGLLLQRLSHTAASFLPVSLELACMRPPPEIVETAPAPEWQGGCLSDSDDEDATFVHTRTFVDFALDPQPPIKMPVPRWIPPEMPVVAESPPPEVIAPVPGKQPGHATGEEFESSSGQSSGRIQLSLSHRNDKMPLRPVTPPTPPPGETGSEPDGVVVRARRGRPPRARQQSHVAPQEGPPTEPEIRAFMMASNLLNEKDELMELCMIFLLDEPDVNADDPIIDVDLAKFKPQTVRALINFAKQRFRMQGYSYPEV